MTRKLKASTAKRIRAGKRRDLFFDVRATRGNDYYLLLLKAVSVLMITAMTDTRSSFIKKISTNFIKALGEAVDYVKTELMPDFDFDAFNHDEVPDEAAHNGTPQSAEAEVAAASDKRRE
jgi:hypothetical protein